MFSELGPTNHKGGATRGTATVEMAIMLPFLLLVLLGVLELSVLIHDQSVITNASREGARYGIAAVGGPQTDAAIQQWVSNYVQNRLISFSPATATTTITRGGSTAGSELRVRVNYPYSFLVSPNLADGFASLLTLSAQTTMRLEVGV